MTLPQRLVSDPEILDGKPIVRGSRISAELILELLAAGAPEDEILEDYPELVQLDIRACLEYATQLAHEWKAFHVSASG